MDEQRERKQEVEEENRRGGSMPSIKRGLRQWNQLLAFMREEALRKEREAFEEFQTKQWRKQQQREEEGRVKGEEGGASAGQGQGSGGGLGLGLGLGLEIGRAHV